MENLFKLLQEVWKSMLGKFLIYTLLFVIVAVAVVVGCRIVFGKPVNITGFEAKQPDQKMPDRNMDTSIIIPKNEIKKEAQPESLNEPVRRTTKSTLIPKKDTQVVNNITAKNVNAAPNTGNLVIGDNGTINVGEVQRKIDATAKEAIPRFINQIKAKNNIVGDFEVIVKSMAGNPESFTYSEEVKQYLQTIYSKVVREQVFVTPPEYGTVVGPCNPSKPNCVQVLVGFNK